MPPVSMFELITSIFFIKRVLCTRRIVSQAQLHLNIAGFRIRLVFVSKNASCLHYLFYSGLMIISRSFILPLIL